MSITTPNLKPFHWDILNLVRTLCYEGLPRTRMACVDPTDRYLPLWKPNPYDSRFTLRNGVPEPFVKACLGAVPFDESVRRWGKDGNDPDPALQYLLDRGLLSSTTSNRPICAAFQNYFTDDEIFSTIRIEENSNGRFYVWKTRERLSSLQIRHGFLITDTPYPVFKLTKRAHELLDAQEAAPTAAISGHDPTGPDANGYVTRPIDPSSYVPITTIRAEHCNELDLTSIKEITKVLENFAANHVRWTRPLNKATGAPNPRRRSMHLGDWLEYANGRKKQQPTASEDGFPNMSPRDFKARKADARRRKRSAGK